MESKVLRTEVDDLKLMLMSPKLFIIKYFDDLINLLDIRTTEAELKGKLPIIKINDWRQLIVDELKQAESESLSKITSDFKLDIELKEKAENLIKIFSEDFNNQQNNIPAKKCNELENKVYEVTVKMQQEMMRNNFFMILKKKSTRNIRTIESLELWRNILPLIRIKGEFIGQKGQQFLE